MSEHGETLTASRLRELLAYDETTGAFSRRSGKRGGRSGEILSGHNTGHGHRQTIIDGKSYYLHRLAWLYVTGCFPNGNIDHINGDAGDNRFANLRDVTHAMNMQNLGKATARSATGLLGVMPDRSRKTIKYRAHITVLGERHHLGSFDTPEDAHQAYLKAKRHMHCCFVEERFSANGERDAR
jgi:hypothetical protein